MLSSQHKPRNYRGSRIFLPTLPEPQAPHPTLLQVAVKKEKHSLSLLPFASSSFIHFTSITLQRCVHYALLHSLHYLSLHFSSIHFSPFQQRTATAFLHSISQALLCFRVLVFVIAWLHCMQWAIANILHTAWLHCQIHKPLQTPCICSFHSVRHLL